MTISRSPEKGKPGPSQADLIVKLSKGIELFHTSSGQDAEAYATIDVGSHRETWKVRSKAFRSWISRAFHRKTGKVPGSQAVYDARATLEGQAQFDGPAYHVHRRIARYGTDVYYDLGDEQWRAVKIQPGSWKVISSHEVPKDLRFIRRPGMAPQVEPSRPGSVDQLRPFVNLTDDDWILFIAFMVHALGGAGPYTILSLNGEQGSAKSTTCELLRALVDPAKPPLRRPPHDERDLMIAASNSYLMAYDNTSHIKATISDAVCSLATGGGFGTRQLYSDDEEKLFDEERPVLFNGIGQIVHRPDLLDRALILEAPPIPEERRLNKADVLAGFETVRPAVLGALFDAVATALKRIENISPPTRTRNADFAHFIVAAEPTLPWDAGQFIEVYLQNRRQANATAIESFLISPYIIALADDNWTGTVRKLLDVLDDRVDDRTRKRDGWPGTPRKLRNDLDRIAPNLRKLGVIVSTGERSAKGRLVYIHKDDTDPAASADQEMMKWTG